MARGLHRGAMSGYFLLLVLPLCVSALSIEETGERNKATVYKQYALQSELNEKSVTPEKIKSILPQLAEIWAPKIDCEIIPTAPEGVELKGVSLGQCAAEVGRIYAGAVVHKFDLVDVTIGPEGKVIIVFEKDTMTKDGKTYILPQFTRFIFNDDGIMIGYMVIFNPGLLRDAPATQQELIGSHIFSFNRRVEG